MIWTAVQEPEVPPGWRSAGPPPADLVEAEALQLLGRSRDFPLRQSTPAGSGSGRWSGDALLVASGTREGDWVEWALPAVAPGRYAVEAHLARAPEHGVVIVSVDRVGIEVDLGSPGGDVVPTGPVEVGGFALDRGPHVLRIEVSAASARSSPAGTGFGIDGVRIAPTAEPAADAQRQPGSQENTSSR